MYIIKGKTFDEVYKKSIMEILKNGDEVSPRGSKTFELAPATIVIEEPRYLLSAPRLRKGNHIFQLAEMLWMVRGSNNVEEIAHYNKQWLNFVDKDEPKILNGAYGERLRNWGDLGVGLPGIDQFAEVYKKLKKDPFSRQAVMIIFDPERDNYIFESTDSYSKDIPCTNYFNFQIRDGKLNMWTVMRSNDLHKGTIYDIPNFITIQFILAGWLGVEVGKYTHSAASFHIYESDIENFIDIHNDKEDVDVYEDIDTSHNPSLIMEDFNKTMYHVGKVEAISRVQSSIEDFSEIENVLHDEINSIGNTWWRSVAAAIALYNYRKLGAHENLFNQFLPYITNEYRNIVKNYKQIKKKAV